MHADEVADRVVRGEPAAELLAPGATADIAAPTGGVNLPGFIDTSDGANLRTGPAETGGKTVIDAGVFEALVRLAPMLR